MKLCQRKDKSRLLCLQLSVSGEQIWIPTLSPALKHSLKISPGPVAMREILWPLSYYYMSIWTQNSWIVLDNVGPKSFHLSVNGFNEQWRRKALWHCDGIRQRENICWDKVREKEGAEAQMKDKNSKLGSHIMIQRKIKYEVRHKRRCNNTATQSPQAPVWWWKQHSLLRSGMKLW